ncbi:hypothetical protein H6F86_24760 [Phormidium sp. FACHB-592]|uniref:Uncharacterized protein n=1 Tax=Stenomitos frigidus AS-A4 TaxID=2933935 RepID=A0ABV0KUE2_9CYAN|nr:hypothetical protein [Phormidium sp. FACHB-592]MBD2077040.1 hypothetical protein [Phormidium sp. FACHB-592]
MTTVSGQVIDRRQSLCRTQPARRSTQTRSSYSRPAEGHLTFLPRSGISQRGNESLLRPVPLLDWLPQSEGKKGQTHWTSNYSIAFLPSLATRLWGSLEPSPHCH